MRVRKTGTFMGSVVAVLLMTAGLSAPAGGVPGLSTKPTVSTLVPSVTSIPHGGGDVLLSATVSMPDGSAMPDGTCQFISNKPVSGLPATVACVAGAVSYGVTIPANHSTKAYSVKFRLAVTGTPGSKPVKSPWSDTVMVDPFLGLASAITARGSTTCAITGLTGTVRCWGDNSHGQLGNKTNIDSLVPVTVKGLSGATAIATGGSHTCALVSGGKVSCWGWNVFGELGDGIYDNSNVPVRVTGLTGAIAIAAGYLHTCALLSGGTVQCWGDSQYGKLGDGSSGSSSTVPVSVSGLSGVTAIAAGGGHTCALLSGGTVQCWGYGDGGQLGNGASGIFSFSSVPVSVTDLTEVTAIAAGTGDTCALITGGTVQCWGRNTWGELGDGTPNNSNVPVSVSSLTGVTGIAPGGGHTCALISGGTVQCWGYNYYGELGNGTSTNSPPYGSYVPVGVVSLTGVTAITAGQDHTCALLSGGTVQCWGRNLHGELGNGSIYPSIVPVSVSGL